MSEICRYISFEELRKQLHAAKAFFSLKPEFLDSFSESCEIDSRKPQARPCSFPLYPPELFLISIRKGA